MDYSDLIRYARAHRFLPIFAGILVVSLTSAVLGGVTVSLPSLGAGSANGIPFRKELPLLSGVFLAASLGGGMSEQERVAGHRFRRTRCLAFISLSVISCGFSFVLETLAVDVPSGVVFVRSIITWLGLGVVSGQLGGARLIWALPVASVFPLVWFNSGDWDWTMRPAADVQAWIIATVPVMLGSLLLYVTRWRWSRLARGAKRHH
ncbi:hypothetical protein [Streptomyces sp. NPDC088760]|uniref:hypothetical protein n=1 Tax=Streptomyces sp. NPDC088760 TaxID=3365890 RepID=UPI00382C9B1A